MPLLRWKRWSTQLRTDGRKKLDIKHARPQHWFTSHGRSKMSGTSTKTAYVHRIVRSSEELTVTLGSKAMQRAHAVRKKWKGEQLSVQPLRRKGEKMRWQGRETGSRLADEAAESRKQTMLAITRCSPVRDRSPVLCPSRGEQAPTVLTGLHCHSGAREGERQASKRGSGEPVKSQQQAIRGRGSLLVPFFSPLCRETELRTHRYSE